MEKDQRHLYTMQEYDKKVFLDWYSSNHKKPIPRSFKKKQVLELQLPRFEINGGNINTIYMYRIYNTCVFSELYDPNKQPQVNNLVLADDRIQEKKKKEV